MKDITEQALEAVSKAKQGEFLGAADKGTVDDAHANEDAIKDLFGGLPNPSNLTENWILARLMREATDYGSRTRQAARVTALKLLGDHMRMFGDKEPEKDVPDEFAEMPSEERRRRIVSLIKKIGMADDLKEMKL